MKVRIITGIFSLLLLLASTAAMAGTIAIDFTSEIATTEPTAPLVVGDVVTGHIEIDEDDLVGADNFTVPGEVTFSYSGPNTFGSASAASGWLFPGTAGQEAMIYARDNYIVTAADLVDVPSWAVLPSDIVVGSVLDIVGIIVDDYDGILPSDPGFTGRMFNLGLHSTYRASEDVVDLNRMDIIDFDKLLSSSFYNVFATGEDVGYGPTDRVDWEVEGPITITSASVVPVPAAVWLFGSGLLGLIGAARRRRAAA